MLLSAVTVAAYNETELETFAAGVIAASDPRAQWIIQNDMMVVIRPATNFELDDLDYAINRAQDLALMAHTIAQRFPGEFHEAGGTLSNGAYPIVGVVIYYPTPAPAPA